MGLLTDVQSIYWSGTEFDSSSARYFSFVNGRNNIGSKDYSNGRYGWAVRSGDVGAVPAIYLSKGVVYIIYH